MDRITPARPEAYDGDKSPDAIEQDIASTRVRLGVTIEALERELAPDHVLERGARALRNSLEPAPGSFHQQIWAYAIPLALIATGLGWLFMLRWRGYQSEAPTSFGEMVGDTAEMDETPRPVPSYAEPARPVEPISLADETVSDESNAGRNW